MSCLPWLLVLTPRTSAPIAQPIGVMLAALDLHVSAREVEKPMHLNTKTRPLLCMALALVVLLAGLAPWASRPAWAATFAVTNLSDAGAGSLRQAILDANASPAADTIS